ncbi:MAG: isopentenyl-diphosphate Delta-isomerase [Pyrinomonadaceae bacterium]
MRIGYKAVFTIFLLSSLMVSAFLMVNTELPPWSHYVSGAGIVLFSVPAALASLRWLGRRNTFLLFLMLGIFALAIETFAIFSGIPYGSFTYSDFLGYKLFGTTPWTIVIAWTPLILAAYAVARIIFAGVAARIVLTAILLVTFDMVLDPGAVYFRFWTFETRGWFYGVPWSNFAGWVVSGIIGAVILEIFLKSKKPLLPVPVQLMESAFLTIFFWTCIALFAGLLLPALIGGLLMIVLGVVYFRNYYAFDDMIVLADESAAPIGTARKLPSHTNDTPLHLAFSVFLINKNGELLLQRRALEKKTWGGVWSNTCCGHQMLHEDVKSAAKRRLKYELGIKGVELEVILPDFRYRAEKDGIVENEICPVLAGTFEGEPKINKREVSETKWIKWEKFLAECNSPDSVFSPWAIEEANLLANNPRFNELLNLKT